MTYETKIKWLSQDDICELFDISRQTLYRWRKSGKFPQPTLTLAKSLAWDADVVDAWRDDNEECGRD